MWFFAVLIVLALGGIAVVAAGRGAPLAEAHDDRPDPGVPAEGPLRSEDLRRVRFPLALRGYRMSDVDALLDRLATQLEAQLEDAARETGQSPDAAGEPPASTGGRGDQPTA
jgi:DivIVA domain-containing protein